ncbi:hypothetical protein HMPREF1493_0624 [Atopobium sp. ICM42b]|nr:hypothetical protein HMPREF1493_0624 [Atopobium sp. ICM42b]
MLKSDFAPILTSACPVSDGENLCGRIFVVYAQLGRKQLIKLLSSCRASD